MIIDNLISKGSRPGMPTIDDVDDARSGFEAEVLIPQASTSIDELSNQGQESPGVMRSDEPFQPSREMPGEEFKYSKTR